MEFTIGFLAGAVVTGVVALKLVERMLNNIANGMKDAGLWPKNPY